MPTGSQSAIHLPLSTFIVEQRGWRVKGQEEGWRLKAAPGGFAAKPACAGSKTHALALKTQPHHSPNAR
jgi:hypothetical protein